MHKLIFILLYDDDVLFSYNSDDMQHDVLDIFFQINRVIINVDKTKMMTIKTIQPRDYPTFIYKGEPIQVMQSFKPLTNRCNVCYEFWLEVGWNSYYMFRNQCNQEKSRMGSGIHVIQCDGGC